jgi:hypothetical protein
MMSGVALGFKVRLPTHDSLPGLGEDASLFLSSLLQLSLACSSEKCSQLVTALKTPPS